MITNKSSFTDTPNHVFDMYELVHVFFYIHVHYKSLLFKLAS